MFYLIINLENNLRPLKVFIITVLLILSYNRLLSIDSSWKVVDSIPNMSLFYMGIECYDSLNCISIANRKAIEPWSRITYDGGEVYLKNGHEDKA